MKSIINALARAHEEARPESRVLPSPVDIPPLKVGGPSVALSPEILKANRVVGFDGSDNATRAFDVLRNTCTKDLRVRIADRPVFAVTSPSAGCGASTTAINLAFSLARLQIVKVLLADLAPQGQGWWQQLGIDQVKPQAKVDRDSVVKLEAGGTAIHATSLLPVLQGKPGGEIRGALHDWALGVRRDLGPVSIVLDLPPLLTDDRVASLISEVDMVVLVLARGKTTIAELDTSSSYLHDASSVQLVLNKAREYDL